MESIQVVVLVSGAQRDEMNFEERVIPESVDGIVPWFRAAESVRTVHNERSTDLPTAPQRHRRAKCLHRSVVLRRVRQAPLEQNRCPTVPDHDRVTEPTPN